MTTIWEKSQWNTSPIAYWTIKYEYKRSGANMQYRFNWKVWLNSSTSYYYDGLQLRLFIDGSQKNITVKGYNASEKGWSYDGTTDWYTVSNKTIGSVSFYATLYDTNAKITDAKSSTYKLTVSGAASVLGSISNFTIGNSIKIPITKYDSSFDHILTIKSGSTTVLIKSGVENGDTVTFDNGILEMIYGLMPNSNTLSFTFELATLSGDDTLGTSTETAMGTLTNADPVFLSSYIQYSDINEKVTEITNPNGNAVANPDIISGKSKLRIVYTAAEGKKGARISKYEFSLSNGMLRTNTESGAGYVDFGEVTTLEDLTLTAKVTDSRGNSTTATKKIPFIKYKKPSLGPCSGQNKIICGRYDSKTGKLSSSGEALKLAVKAEWASLPNKTNTATLAINVESANGSSGWKTIDATAQGGGQSNNYVSWYEVDTIVPNVTLKTDTLYTVTVRILDKLTFSANNATKIPYTIPTDTITFHLGDKGLCAAFGMYAQSDRGKSLQIAEDWTLDVLGSLKVGGRSLLDITYPVGSTYMTVNNTSPATLLGGGTWELIDKEFESTGGSSTALFTTTTTAVTTGTSYFARSGHTLRFKIPINYAGVLSGTNLVMGRIKFEELGVSSIGFSITDAVVFSDKSGNGVSYTISNTADTNGNIGQVTFNNIIGTSGTSHTYYIDHTIVFNQKNMLDECCNKFYWKRKT